MQERACCLSPADLQNSFVWCVTRWSAKCCARQAEGGRYRHGWAGHLWLASQKITRQHPQTAGTQCADKLYTMCRQVVHSVQTKCTQQTSTAKQCADRGFCGQFHMGTTFIIYFHSHLYFIYAFVDQQNINPVGILCRQQHGQGSHIVQVTCRQCDLYVRLVPDGQELAAGAGG